MFVAWSTKSIVVICSFGYCEKEEVNGHKPVGQYGNGFKSGSMRIGRDAVVFTKTEDTMSIGMLSQTYLEAIEAETILVPIITWKRSTYILLPCSWCWAYQLAFTLVYVLNYCHWLCVWHFLISACDNNG